MINKTSACINYITSNYGKERWFNTVGISKDVIYLYTKYDINEKQKKEIKDSAIAAGYNIEIKTLWKIYAGDFKV